MLSFCQRAKFQAIERVHETLPLRFDCGHLLLNLLRRLQVLLVKDILNVAGEFCIRYASAGKGGRGSGEAAYARSISPGDGWGERWRGVLSWGSVGTYPSPA